jgi:hypothetical protein
VTTSQLSVRIWGSRKSQKRQSSGQLTSQSEQGFGSMRNTRSVLVSSFFYPYYGILQVRTTLEPRPAVSQQRRCCRRDLDITLSSTSVLILPMLLNRCSETSVGRGKSPATFLAATEGLNEQSVCYCKVRSQARISATSYSPDYHTAI